MSGNGLDVERMFDNLKRGVRGTYEMLRGSNVGVEDYTPSVHGPLISFSGIAGYDEIQRYWVDMPFAFVSINYDAEENEHLYYVVEPELDDWEITLLDNLVTDLRDTLIHRREVGEENTELVIKSELESLLGDYGVVVDANTFYRFLYYLDRRFRGFEKLDPIMRDPYVEDISCDGYDTPVFVYHSEYTDIKTNVEFGEEALDDFVVRLAQRSGQNISIGDPIAHAMLPDGSRSELALGTEVTPHGSAFTIRKYSEEPFTPVTLMDYGTFNLDHMAYLWLAIENNKSLIFAGGTASGKTTSMNAVSMFVPPRSKVLTIEDTQEIRLYHDNWLSAVTRENVGEGSDVDMYALLRSALRHRPEYIVVGEVRGEEAMTLFQAMNTGHTTYSTMHADSIQTVINRLENDPINVPRAMIQSLDILSVQTISHSEGERVRRSREVSEIVGIDQRTGDLDYQSVFSWRPSDDEFRSSIGQSKVLADIREEHGWSELELQRELRNRKRVLKYASEMDVTDFQTFTAIVNEYYADPDGVLDRVDEELDEETTTLAK
jgi:flagellar protein FlaI